MTEIANTEIAGIHHLGMTVSDVERSARWYEEVLGFERTGALGDSSAERQKVFLRHVGAPAWACTAPKLVEAPVRRDRMRS